MKKIRIIGGRYDYISPNGVADVNDALSSQADYWNAYNDNLDKLLKKTDKISGLRDVIATFADGSEDSVNAIAGMADASDDDLKAMVENWKKVQAEQKETSDNLAELKTDFSSQLSNIKDDVKDTIEGLNLASSAKSAASATIEAYADALIAGKGSVESAASIIAGAVTAGLGTADKVDENSNSKDKSPVFTPNKNTNGGGFMQFPNVDIPTADWRGYAVGTYDALSGLALVGERGPELVNFNGGEQVLTAETTKALLSRSSGGSATVTVSPTINIYGNADEETAQESAEQIVEMVIAALDERGIDARRGEYV